MLVEEGNYTLMQNLKSMILDLAMCVVSSFINCLILLALNDRMAYAEWTNRKIGVVIVGISLLNLMICYPFAAMKWWFYDRIFQGCPWSLGENYLDIYTMSSVTSIIVVSYMLIWVTSALRQKEKNLAEARIKALKNRINPHFLFNNLSAGIALIDQSPEKAVDFFTSMARVYRTVLDRSMQTTQPLKAELNDLEQYLNLLRIRFGEALTIDCRLNETDMKMRLLTGSLQLIFENIVKHNRFSAEEPIKVSLAVSDCILQVANDYRPLSEKSGSHGIGQSAIIGRYEELGKHNISFHREEDLYISKLPLFPPK